MLYPTAIKAGMPVSGHPAPTAGLPPALANQPAGTQLNGTIVGGAGAGQLLLRTVAGMVFVNSTLKLARGTVVSLRICHGATPFLAIDSVISGPAGPAKPGLSPTMASGLNQALGVLRKVDPGLAEGVVRRAMAIPGDKLVSVVLIFMAALKSGDFTAWFGPEAAWVSYTTRSYFVAMAVLGAVEFLVRKLYFRHYEGGPIDGVFAALFPAENTAMGRRSAAYIAAERAAGLRAD